MIFVIMLRSMIFIQVPIYGGLTMEKKSVWEKYTEADKKKAFDFADSRDPSIRKIVLMFD